jgi:CelD/BcsL family acetyltransferase involved in cellulose biosynthesis
MLSRQGNDSLDRKAANPYTIDLISTEKALSALEADWNRLSEAAEQPNAFMTYGWFRAWTRRRTAEYPAGRFVPNVLVLSEGSSVVGIAPLVRRISSRIGIRVRRLEFATNHADYNELLLGTDSTGLTDEVMHFLARTTSQWDLIDLRDMRDTGETIGPIKSALERAGLLYAILPENHACPYLPIDRDDVGSLKRLSGHVRRTLRRRRERAAAEGLRVRIIENPQDEPKLLEKLTALDWQKHIYRSSPAFISNYPEVLQSLFDSLGPRGWLYVALLELEERPIAFQFGFRCGDKLWDYTKAYDRSFSRFAPGILILPSLLEFGLEHGYREYDFLRGEEEYKKIWSTGSHSRFRLLIWNWRSTSRIRKFLYHDVKNTIYKLLG